MNFFHTHISDKSLQNVKEVMESTYLSEGGVVKEFEEQLQRQLGILNPVAVNSGTSALHLALATSGVGKGDEVIIPPQTFVATGLAVLYTGAKPVFADIQYETGNIDPKSITEKITKKTKAIIPVHWGGYPCDLEEINNLAHKHNITVIEDAAHALGADYHSKPIGSVSEYTAFSFQAIKHITTGDGGALACLDQEKMKLAKSLSWFGIDRENSKPSILGEREYNISQAGFKYHMNNVAAAIGLGNLEDFNDLLNCRRKIAAYYKKELKSISGIRLLDYQDNRTSSYWLFTILVERREDFIKKLLSKNIPTSVVHLRIDHNSIFGGVTKGLRNQEMFNDNQISIPIHSGLTYLDVEKIVGVIKSGW